MFINVGEVLLKKINLKLVSGWLLGLVWLI